MGRRDEVNLVKITAAGDDEEDVANLSDAV